MDRFVKALIIAMQGRRGELDFVKLPTNGNSMKKEGGKKPNHQANQQEKLLVNQPQGHSTTRRTESLT